MKFIVSSVDLLSHLQVVSKVISNKNTLPILDHFLFNLSDEVLTITASDLETTMISKLEPENVDGNGLVAIEAKRLMDILKEFPEQPLTFNIDEESLQVDIVSENGKYSVVAMEGEEFPKVPELNEDQKSNFTLEADILNRGINKTLFATADDDLRPVMNGVFFKISAEDLTFVASDSHKLVRYRRTDVSSEKEASFILPKKPATMLKGILAKEIEPITIEFDEKNAVFNLSGHKLICRLTEGQFPNYQSVIPQDNPNKLSVSRQDFLNSLKRVSVFSNQASNLIKMSLTDNVLTVSAQDIDFSISAYEKVNCRYEGDEMDIGFKSSFLAEILTNMSGQEVVVEMSDPSRAGIILPLDKLNDNEDELMLLMPMMINS